MFTRSIQEQITSYMFEGKVILLLGPRQVGKTTLIETLLRNTSESIVQWTGDNALDRELLSESRFERLRDLIGEARYIFIDEAQKIQNIGDVLKQLVDRYKNEKQIIVTGSSSFHVLEETSEPLTGRKITFLLYPISTRELVNTTGSLEFTRNLEEYLVYGMYPDILNTSDRNKKQRYLIELTNSNLYRDILEFQEVRNSTSIHKLLRILALNVGSEISYNQIGSLLSMDGRTIERYVDLLEKSFIIFRLPPFFTNKLKELSKMHKIYFYDLGIRNALIGDFRDISLRDDIGKLWENYMLVEQMKSRVYANQGGVQYFWRSYDQQEIDLVIESVEGIFGYEYKWSPNNKPRAPGLWKSLYPEASYEVISRENMLKFL